MLYLKRAAVTDEKDEAYSLELAKTLSIVSQYEQSNLIYLKLLAKGHIEGKCYFGLSQNLYYLNELEHSIYYLNLYMDKYSETDDSEDDDEYIEIIEEGDDFNGYEIVYPLEKQDMTDTINQARSFMKAGLFEKAIVLLKKVPKGNIDYLFARNNLALCCFFLNDYNNTKIYSNEVLSIDENNIFALCNLAAMYNYINDSANSSIYLKRFLNIGTEDITDLFKIATTLCELKEHALALKYLKQILRQKSYDTNIIFLTAIACYNNKLISEAEDMFLKLINLNEKDYAAKYYLKLIRQITAEKDIESGFFQSLEYICQVPYGEMLERIKKLRTLLYKNSELKKLIVSDGSILELCDWCFTISDIKFQKLLINRISGIKDEKAENFLKEKLIDPNINPHIKKYIIEKFILNGIKPKYYVSIDYVVKTLNPEIVKAVITERIFYQAYALAYSTMVMFSAENIESDLFYAYKQMIDASKNFDSEFKNKKALAAVMAYKSKKIKLIKIRRNMCKMFNADFSVFEKYLKALNLN